MLFAVYYTYLHSVYEILSTVYDIHEEGHIWPEVSGFYNGPIWLKIRIS
jgi:hypothetical protein